MDACRYYAGLLVGDLKGKPKSGGQIAGAFYGAEQIPPEWRAKLTTHDFIQEKADQLFAITELSDSDS